MTDELFRISRQNSMTSVGGEDFADMEVAQTLGPRTSPTPAFLPPDGQQLSRSVSRVQLKRWASDGWRKARGAGNYWLLFGIAAALLWINLDHESYEYFVGAEPAEPHYAPFGNTAVIFDHPVTFHFLVNDIFMVFFFGLAAKEVTDACLPGGSLSSPRKALAPLIATVGGVLGPIAVFTLTLQTLYGGGAFHDYLSSAAIDARHALLHIERDALRGNATPPEPAVCSLHENARGQCALADDRDFSWEQTWFHHAGYSAVHSDGMDHGRRLRGGGGWWLRGEGGQGGEAGGGASVAESVAEGVARGVGAEAGAAHRQLGAIGRRKSTKPKPKPLVDAVAAKRGEKLGWAEVKNGWGVPTATDISLAWVIALAVFPKGHPAIEFLLLLAVADDAIGLGIIAIAYPDPHHPVQPQWMGLALVGVLFAYLLRRCGCMSWGAYLVLGGIPAWVALLKSALHPALALVFIVPFLPAKLPPGYDPTASQRCTLCDAGVTCTLDSRRVSAAVRKRLGCFACLLCGDEDGDSSHDDELMGRHAHAPLHAFEHALKVPVEIGMFFFTLANAGVKLGSAGPLTVGVFTALVAGKMLGITTLVCLASCLRIAPLAEGMTLVDVVMVSAVASVGLTVALFVSGEAYQHEELQSESKLGALLSGLMGLVCYGISKTSCWPHNKKPSLAGMDASKTSQVGPANDEGAPNAGLSREDSACSATAVVDGGLDERSLDGHDAAGIWGACGGHNSSCRNSRERETDRYSTPAAYAVTAQQHAWLKQGAPQRQRWHHS